MWRALKESKFLQKTLGWAGLFGSFGTLICCAIPSTLVLLGFGATLASFLGNFPQLIWLSEHKELVFGFSFALLGLSYAGQKYAQTQTCPIEQREDCEAAKSWARPIFWISLGINLVGAFYAFALPHLLD